LSPARTPAPPPITIIADIYPLACVRVCCGQMYAMVILEGHVSGQVTNAQHELRVSVTYDYNSIRLL